jgi:hypothetical protein
MANSFRSFVFKMRFDKQTIAAVPHEKQLERIRCYLGALGEVHPLLGKWHRSERALPDGLPGALAQSTTLVDRDKSCGMLCAYEAAWLASFAVVTLFERHGRLAAYRGLTRARIQNGSRQYY